MLKRRRRVRRRHLRWCHNHQRGRYVAVLLLLRLLRMGLLLLLLLVKGVLLLGRNAKAAALCPEHRQRGMQLRARRVQGRDGEAADGREGLRRDVHWRHAAGNSRVERVRRATEAVVVVGVRAVKAASIANTVMMVHAASRLPVPQDRVFRLSRDGVEELA